MYLGGYDMRVIKEGTTKVVVYDGVADMIGHLRNATDLHREGTDPVWSGTTSLGEALDLCDKGWTEGRQIVEDTLANLKTSLRDMAEEMVQVMYHDVAGAYPDMGRYMEGDPECMVEFSTTASTTVGQVCRILVDCGANANYTSDWMARRAAAITAFIEVLTAVGKSVEVWVASPVTHGSNGIHDTVICAHRAGATLNVADIAYLLGHPSMLRHCVFQTRWDYATGFHDQGMGATYGKHLEQTVEMVQPDVMIQRAENEPREVPDPARDPLKWVRYQAEKLGLL